MNNVIYISGPMSGLPNYNFDAFDRAEEIIRARGDLPMNPAQLGRKWCAENGYREMTEAEYKKILDTCLRNVRYCHGIYLLKGWENSYGAKQELMTAIYNGKKVELQTNE